MAEGNPRLGPYRSSGRSARCRSRGQSDAHARGSRWLVELQPERVRDRSLWFAGPSASWIGSPSRSLNGGRVRRAAWTQLAYIARSTTARWSAKHPAAMAQSVRMWVARHRVPGHRDTSNSSSDEDDHARCANDEVGGPEGPGQRSTCHGAEPFSTFRSQGPTRSPTSARTGQRPPRRRR